MAQQDRQTKRGARFWSLVVLAGIVLAGAAVWLLLQLDGPRRFAANTAVSAIGDEDLRITYGDLSGNWPWRIGITDLEISDEQGPWLSIETLTLDWSPFAILGNRVRASRLSIENSRLLRLPETPPDPASDRHVLPEIPDLGIEIAVQSLSITNLAIAETVFGHAADLDVTGTVQWTEQELRGDIDLTERADGGLTASLDFLLHQKDETLDLAIAGEESASGLIHRLAEVELEAPLAFSLEGKGPSRDWRGKLRITADGYGSSDTDLRVTNAAPLAITISSDIDLQARMRDDWKRLSGSAVNVALSATDVTLDGGTIVSSELRTASGLSAALKGRINLADNAIDVALDTSVDDANIFSSFAGPNFAGRAAVTATITGTLDDSSVKAELAGEQIIVDRTEFGNVTGKIDWPGSKIQAGQIDIVIDSPLGPGTVKSAIARDRSGNLTFTDLNADWLTTKIGGEFTLTSDGHPYGSLTFDVGALEQISFLSQFAGIPKIRGAALGSISIPEPSLSRESQFRLELANFRAGSGTDMFAIKKLEASGRLEAEAGGAVNLTATAEEVDAPGLLSPNTIGKITLSADGRNDNANWNIETSQINQSKDSLTARGSYRRMSGGQKVSIDQLSGALAGEAIKIDQPLIIAEQQNGWSLQPFSLHYGTGNAGGSADFREAGAQAKVNLSQLPVAVSGIGFETIEGDLSGSVTLDTLSAQKSGSASLVLSSDAGPLATTTIDADWDGARLIIAGSFEGAGTFDGSLPLTYEDGAFDIPGNGSIGLAAALRGPIGPLWRLGPLSEYVLTGLGSLDVSASGTWGDPIISGVASLQDGYFESYSDGIFLADLALNLRAENSERATMTLTATDGKKGRVKGEGDVRFIADQKIPMTITADFDKAEIVRGETVDARLSGRVTLAGNTDALRLTGDLTVNRMDVRIPSELPPTVIDLPAELVNVPPALRDATTTDGDTSDTSVSLDVRINAPNRVFVEGRGLSSEWKAKATLKGDADRPRIEGRANIIKGSFEFAGRPFDLERGTITFDGGKEIDPQLNVLATRDEDDIKVGVQVKGPASDPTISLQSTPALPQEDVLARILFGKPVAELSYTELAQLGESIATLSGRGLGGGGRGLFGTVRQSLGIDVLSVDAGSIATDSTDEDAVGPSLTVGKYVTNRVYVGVTQGTDEDSTAVEVDVDITRRLSLSTEVGQKANSNIGLNWSWDY